MMDPRQMSNDGLIKDFIVKTAELISKTSDLIDSPHDDQISRNSYILRLELMRRMGDLDNAHNSALLDELTKTTTTIQRCFQIKKEILLKIAKSLLRNATMATASQS